MRGSDTCELVFENCEVGEQLARPGGMRVFLSLSDIKASFHSFVHVPLFPSVIPTANETSVRNAGPFRECARGGEYGGLCDDEWT